eukprot:1263694-Prymnesium_polylepis.1
MPQQRAGSASQTAPVGIGGTQPAAGQPGLGRCAPKGDFDHSRPAALSQNKGAKGRAPGVRVAAGGSRAEGARPSWAQPRAKSASPSSTARRSLIHGCRSSHGSGRSDSTPAPAP